MPLEDYDAVAGIARGTWYFTKLVLRRFMLRQGSGRIINITSVVGHTGNAGQAPYTMVKAGLDALTKSLAQELAGRAILVNSVAPGFIATDMTAGAVRRRSARRSCRASRSGGWERPDEVAEVVAFLATRAHYVHGTVAPRERGAPWRVSAMTPAEVLAAIPHRPPFRFVDEIVELDDEHIVAAYRFPADADFYRGHFPGNPITPGVLLLEAMAQAGVVAHGIYLLGRSAAASAAAGHALHRGARRVHRHRAARAARAGPRTQGASSAAASCARRWR